MSDAPVAPKCQCGATKRRTMHGQFRCHNPKCNAARRQQAKPRAGASPMTDPRTVNYLAMFKRGNSSR